ncbi:DUF2778 domain-containing protein [Methylobacterium sp. BTF04]|uniref:DUF2778 domain-containing protein n=1 Tax=Methylobacterium sp. BTF04 TaxID=2708300 RepID=UPI001FED45B3|nr:DUF2778 domain-containing protein [Methylobacterium sp. BTF04]
MNSILLVAAASGLGFTAWTHLFGTDAAHRTAPVSVAQALTPTRTAAADATGTYAWMLDPNPALGSAARLLGPEDRNDSAFRLDATNREAAALPLPSVRERVRVAASTVQATVEFVQTAPIAVAASVPLPVPRPPELRRPRPVDVQRLASRPVLPRTQTVFRAAIGEERSFFETIFGVTPGNTLAYAAVDTGAVAPSPLRRLSPGPGPSAGAMTAIYDISARTVYLPNGEAIEAHSGLGASMDDPRHVHLSMRGATPPGTYDLTEREQLFHGVRAIRLNPVGGSGAIHGRVGLLAHTYMLGASGASNGCVSFKNYDRFLQAYLRGEIRRLVVVAGSLQDGPPGTGNRRLGLSGRPGAVDG